MLARHAALQFLQYDFAQVGDPFGASPARRLLQALAAAVASTMVSSSSLRAREV
jgi:hypothetical protein